MGKTGFIYIWYDRKHKRFYIGCHWGTEDDGYICSSTWMRNSFKRRPNDFKRRIIRKGITKENLLEEEYKWLQLIPDDQLGKKYYNLIKGIGIKGRKGVLPEKTKEKLRIANLGKTLSEETKRKISEAGRKRKGEKRSLTARQNYSKAAKGRIPWNKGKTYRMRNAKYIWKILGPDNTVYVERGIDCFAKEHNICANNLRTRKKSKGYTVIEKKVV